MHTPPLVGWLLVALCAATGGYCLSRTRTGPAAQRVTARGEALMALGMAVMALPASVVVLPGWSAWAFTAVFGAAALWALLRRHLHHAVGALAMVYMALAMGDMEGMGGTEGMEGMGAVSGMSGMPGMVHSAPAGVPVLTGLLLAYYTVYVLAAGVRLAPVGDGVAAGSAAAGGAWSAGTPVVLRACQVAMGLGMLAMLTAL
ncbi:hypothetical protein ADL22_18895 [Streptomyces sp. NRRL F-4489]|uniref:DUF5134 domain-containing protein n=1 Tax=Streptomyces sp. NRRL F-4489 TaxID=1609095 RepID=UPI000748E366|nr:DUF5134 domain-containing protein [Streptomyces sp. NRRL F-4489]KUL38178.1 hypothetical protein ADL22_18895 [Streptomyces sp. NRRL F-4489]